MKRININTWDMSLRQFISHYKCHNFKQYIQHTGSFKNLRQCGCDYYIYVSLEDLSIINPYSKTYKGEKYKAFFSSASPEDCKTKAYNFIQESININKC